MKKQEKIKPFVTKKYDASQSVEVFWQRRYFFELLIFCFSFLLFANSILNNYNLDDELVTINHRLTAKGIAAIPEIFSSPYYQDESGYSYEYRPIVLTSFAIEHDIFGDNPHWSHFWNVFLYSLACALLYRVLRRLLHSYSILLPVGIAILFAVHPAHTEIVCSIKNRDEILGLLFSILSFHFGLKYLDRKRWMLVFVPCFFILALLSKVTFAPFAILIPLAIFLFKDFSIQAMAWICVSLVIPVLIIANIGDTLTKVLLTLMTAGSAIIIYLFKYWHQSQNNLRLLRGRLLSQPTFSWQESGDDSRAFRDLFKEIIPTISLQDLLRVALHSFVFSIYIIAAHFHLGWIQLILSLIWALLLFQKSEAQNWITYLFVYAVVIFKLYYQGIYSHHYAIDFLFFVSGFYLLYGTRSLFIPSALSFASGMLLYTLLPKSDAGIVVPISTLVILAILRYRWSWIIAIAFFAIALITDLTDESRTSQSIIISLLFNISIVVFLFSIYLKKYPRYIAKGFLVIALVGVSIVNWNQRQDAAVVNTSVRTISKINLKISPKTENRPIQYVENCIDLHQTPEAIKIGTSLEILLHYLVKTIVPYPLSYYYGYSFIKPMKVTDTIPLISLFIHFLLVAAAFFFYKTNKLLCFGILLYFISIALFSNYFVATPGMVADRFIFIPSLGWIVVLMVLLLHIFKVPYTNLDKNPIAHLPPAARYAFIVILCFYSVISFSRNFDWKDYLTLFEHDIHYVQNSSQAHNLLAIRLMKTSYDDGVTADIQLDKRQKALVHFRKAIEIYPLFFNAVYDLGRTYQILGNADSAIFYFTMAASMDSSFITASVAAGELLMQQNKTTEAIPLFENSIKQYPKDFAGYERLSGVFFLRKEYDRSIDLLKRATVEMPQNALPYIGLAKVYHNINKDDSTRYWLHRAIEVDPNGQEARNLLNSLGPQ